MTSETTAEPAPLNRRGLIPVWAPLLVMAAVFLTGVVLGGVGTPYLVLFLLTAVICTSLVELRGLFLTVVLLPVYWFVGVTAAGLISDSSGAWGNSRKTALITAAYPAIENFLWLLVAFLLCVVIAVVRQRIDAAALESQRRRERARRRKMSESEQNNQRLNSRVRSTGREPGRPVGREDEYDSSPVAPTPRGATPPGPRPEVRSEPRTRTAAELREASRRRRSRSQDTPLDTE